MMSMVDGRSSLIAPPRGGFALVGESRVWQSRSDYALQTYALDNVEGAIGPLADGAISLGDPYHYRMTLAQGFGSGSFEFCGLSDGFFIAINDVNFSSPFAANIATPDALRIRIALDSNGEYLPSQGEILDIRGPGAGVMIEPGNAPPAEVVSVGQQSVAQIIVHREALRRLYPRDDQLPALIRAFLANDLEHRVSRQLPRASALLRCLDDMRNCSLTGRNRWLFLRSKAVEILCHTFDGLEEGDCHAAEPSALVERAVLQAKRLLTEQFMEPPSLDDLARKVGLSRTSLCANFGRLTGRTVFDFVVDLRMQQALAMLTQQDIPITEIAYAVGYQYPSSFTVAVHRHFGMSPTELRRRRLPTGQG